MAGWYALFCRAGKKRKQKKKSAIEKQKAEKEDRDKRWRKTGGNRCRKRSEACREHAKDVAESVAKLAENRRKAGG